MTNPNGINFERLLSQRYVRREHLKRLFVGGYGLAMLGLSPESNAKSDKRGKVTSSLSFKDVAHCYDEKHHVADGYKVEVLLRWGDPIFPGAPGFNPLQQTAVKQARQFGFNNDFIAFMPLPRGSVNSDRGLLCVNHEYPIGHLMFSGYSDRSDAAERETIEQLQIEQEATGLSIVEIQRVNGSWQQVLDSPYTRRITATTAMKLTGPVACHARVKTSHDPEGVTVLGTLANCAGGVTPWGTILTCEENLQEFFWGDQARAAVRAPRELASWRSFGVGKQEARDAKPEDGPHLSRPMIGWSRLQKRFDIEQEPHEPNRFGWIVEIDPYDPQSTPRKHTALGRFRHEGATLVTKHGQPVVVYSGDDQEFQFIYKFVSHGKYDAENQAKNRNILENGYLYAAKFNADGTGRWLILNDSLEVGDWPIDVRQIAQAKGATPMDRPEDIETSNLTDRTYVALTKNPNRLGHLTDASNPLAENYWGHILEIIPPGVDGNRDHCSEGFTWEFLVFGGNPSDKVADRPVSFHPDTGENGWFSNPDNLVFDNKGRLWVSTDGMPSSSRFTSKGAPIHDGIWALELNGADKAYAKHFFGGPRGAELTGICFTPDNCTLFASVQHPAEEAGSTFDNPSTRWPDFNDKMPPRPSVIVVQKEGGTEIGS